jgi:hypothetical protein
MDQQITSNGNQYPIYEVIGKAITDQEEPKTKEFREINTKAQSGISGSDIESLQAFEEQIAADTFRKMAAYGRKRARHYSELNPKLSSTWGTWAHYKELEAEYHESQI